MLRISLFAAALLPAALAAQQQECLGYDLTNTGQRIPLAGEGPVWTLYNLGPAEVVIFGGDGSSIPGPAPQSDPTPTAFRGEAERTYEIGLAAPGLSIVYICPGN